MITATKDKIELFTAIDEAVLQLLDLISPLDERSINIVPYKDSWTAGQLLSHVTKSTAAMAKAMATDSKQAERDPAERIEQLKTIFLDFSRKLKSPDFIVPEDRQYVKQDSINDLKRAFEQLKKNADSADLTELVEGLPLGPITKLEILHFVLYHTQRHLHQLKKIVDALNKETGD